MDEADRARAMAEHVFTRTIVMDLMVWQCMQEADPVAAVDERSKFKLAVADNMLAKRPQEFTHRYLVELETFWEGVRYEVGERVRFAKEAAAGQKPSPTRPKREG